MTDRDRFKLLGTYRTPRFHYGAVVVDELRGSVRIVGLSDAPIPWPVGQYLDDKRRRFLVVYGALARAVRRESNQAVAKAWGVTPQTVTVWRKALDVKTVNDGTFRLMRERALTPEFQKTVLSKAWARLRDPDVREKMAASRRGKPLSPAAIERLRAANLGRKLSAEHRRKLSKAQRRRGTWPPAAGRPWSKEEDQVLRTMRPKYAAKKTGRTLAAVLGRRNKLKLPDGRVNNGTSPRADGWTLEEDKVVRTLRAKDAAARTSRSLEAVYSRRHDLKVPDGRVNNGGHRR